MQGVLLVIEILFIMFLLAKQAISILLWFMSIIMFQMSFVIIPGLFEPPVRTLRATIPENESHIFR